MSTSSSSNPAIEKALKAALDARQNSHSPYSKFKVGAALKLKGREEFITGCNVENASFGATICAERTALSQAVSRFGKSEIEFLVVATDEKKATVPCALCLQMLAEFAADEMPVHLGNPSGILRSYKFKELLPFPFRAFEAKP